jgi:hypothetical protein
MRGMGLSHEISNIAEAEPVRRGEGYMCGAVTRGAAALPGSKAISCMKGARRNLGSPVGSFGWSPKGVCGKGQPELQAELMAGWRIGVYV